MNKIRIYQIPSKLDIPYMFMNYDFAKEHNLSIHDYVLMYDCERETNNLEDIFEEFNLRKPEDFRGWSLSTSDIVEMNGTYYYCDSFGWKELTEDERS